MMMVQMEWSDKLSVGVTLIDEDHKKLVAMVNELFSACFAGVGDEVVTSILAKVIDYTHYHFSREEALLRELNSPDLEKQMKEHSYLIQQVTAISQQGATALSEEVLLFLRDWLTHHILETDMASFRSCR
ncbi:MAG: hemerythrin family protein [Magnetococcales bacterium]|nr:hemerythrin family protein [Magnetococcales bacterium]NGZ27653.1 hemerythrin family protein [Magnetococcales bacterium]